MREAAHITRKKLMFLRKLITSGGESDGDYRYLSPVNTIVHKLRNNLVFCHKNNFLVFRKIRSERVLIPAEIELLDIYDIMVVRKGKEKVDENQLMCLEKNSLWMMRGIAPRGKAEREAERRGEVLLSLGGERRLEMSVEDTARVCQRAPLQMIHFLVLFRYCSLQDQAEVFLHQ